MNPILKYPGAKWRLAHWILERMPPHVGYVEPFFGSGAVFFNKTKSRIETLADLDGSVVRCRMSFGARTACNTGWRNTTGKTRNTGPDNPAMWRRLPEVVVRVAERLRDSQIENRPALDVIQHNNGPEILIYADPPYLKGTRTLGGDQYRHEMTDADHEALLQALLAHRGMVMLSGYDCELYRNMLRGWRMECVTTQAERGVKRAECLWSNPACVERLA